MKWLYRLMVGLMAAAMVFCLSAVVCVGITLAREGALTVP